MLGKDMRYRADIVHFKIQSAAFGDNFLHYFDSQGVAHVDMYINIKRSFKFESYKLDSVLRELLKVQVSAEKKEDCMFLTILPNQHPSDVKPGDYVQLIGKEKTDFL
jgi:DNA polymerase elongation subunit (family B)